MLEVLKDGKQKSKTPSKRKDIIVKRAYEVETIENNKKTIERKFREVNLTKKINETAKLLKTDNATQKLKELTEILQREK